MQVPLNEYEFPTAKVSNVQSELQRLVEKNYYLNQSARDAFRAYVLAYNSHSLKDIFNVHSLDLAAVAQSFGFEKPPRVRPPETICCRPSNLDPSKLRRGLPSQLAICYGCVGVLCWHGRSRTCARIESEQRAAM